MTKYLMLLEKNMGSNQALLLNPSKPLLLFLISFPNERLSWEDSDSPTVTRPLLEQEVSCMILDFQ